VFGFGHLYYELSSKTLMHKAF